jgi:Secretion system C-terminal sorting domain
MKTLILSLLFTTNIIFIQAQETIYGIELDSVTNNHYFVSINPNDASISQIDTIPNLGVVKNGTAALNSISDFYVFAGFDKLLTKIYTIDINNGATIASPSLSAQVEELCYDQLSGNYYAIEKEDTSTVDPSTPLFQYHLVSVNASTGIVSRINVIPGVNGISLNNSTYNHVNQEYTFISDNDEIYTIDVNTGTVLSETFLINSIIELQLNLKTGVFFGIHHDDFSNANYLATINPTNGSVSLFFSSLGINNFKPGTSTIDTLNNRFSIVDNNNELTHIDLSSASISSSTLLTSLVNHLCIKIIPAPIATRTVNGESKAYQSFREGNLGDLNSIDEEFMAYPNPAANVLTIKTSQSPTLLSIYNLNGVLVETKKLTDNMNRIDISNYENGLYLFNLSNLMKTETKKISIHK